MLDDGGRAVGHVIGTADTVALHLGMVTANVRARGFCDRLGCTEVPVADAGPVSYLGIATT